MSKDNPLIVLRCVESIIDKGINGYSIRAVMEGQVSDIAILEGTTEELKHQWEAINKKIERIEIRPHNTLEEETIEFLKLEHKRAVDEYDRQIAGLKQTIAYLQNELSESRYKPR